MPLLKKKVFKNSNIFEKMEALNLISNMYILIEPSKAFEKKDDILNSDRLITMSSEEFLWCFQSLLGASEKECYFNSNPSALDLKADSENRISGNLQINVENQMSKLDGLKQFSNVGIQTESDYFLTGNEAMGKCVTSAPCGNCFAMKNPNPTKDEKASGNSPVLKLANALKDSSKCNFVSKEKMLPSTTEKDIKEAVSILPPHIKNVALRHYCKHLDTNLNLLAPSRYVYAHLSLFSDFSNVLDFPPKAFTSLVRRYTAHLKRLLNQFYRDVETPERIMEFDQLVLNYVRKIGGWDFKRAWRHADEEWKENRNQMIAAPVAIHKEKSNTSVRSLRAVNPKHDSPPFRRKLTRLKVDPRTSDIKRPTLSEDEIETVSSFDKSVLLDRKVLASKRPYRLRSPDNWHSERQMYDLESRAYKISPEQVNKRLKCIDTDTSSFCKFFNQGYCFKLTQQCSHVHACNICGERSHYRLKCPSFEGN